MKISNAGARVYRADNLVIWIPTAALVAVPAGGIGVPGNTVWQVDI